MTVKGIFTKKVVTWLSIIGGGIVVITAIFQLDERWNEESCISAYAQDVKANGEKIEELTVAASKISKRLDQKILEDQSNNLQNRMWKLEDRYGQPAQMTPEQREIYRNLQLDKKKVDDRIKALKNSS